MNKGFLENAQVGKIELNEQRRIRKQINERWDKLGMTEGLKGVLKENIATLFENQAKYILSEATSSDNSGSFETVVFPIIRRAFSRLLANEIVSVQAMNLPVGRLFFILPVTSKRDWNDEGTVGKHKGLMGYERTNRFFDENAEGPDPRAERTNKRFYLPDEVVGDVKGTKVTEYEKKTLYDLFYNDYLFDNTKGRINIKVGTATPMVWKKGELAEIEDWDKDVKLYADGSVRNLVVKVTGFSSFNKGKLTGPDGNEMDTEAFLASLKVLAPEAGIAGDKTTFEGLEAIQYRVVTQKYGKGIVEYDSAVDEAGALYIDLDLTKPCKKQGQGVDGYIGVDKTALQKAIEGGKLDITWAQYDSLELETELPEVSFKLDSVTVSVEERKLRATWSPELAQDVNAFHNIDAEAELTALLSEQVGAEVDREILRDLRVGSAWRGRFDVNGWRRMAGFSTNYTQKDWNQELFTKINQISAQINKATLRGSATFVVVSSEVSALLDNLEYFHVSDASAESDQYSMGIEKIGSLASRYQVYRDPYSPAGSIIIGHKGKSLLDTGYIYAPYIPMQLTPTLINPHNFAPVKGIMTRYAKKCVNNRFYGTINVDGLTVFNIDELR